MKNNSINLGRKIIDKNNLYFIADIGANHDGSLDRAIELIHLAKDSGANAAKFQNFEADKIVSDIGFRALNGKQSHQSKWKKSVFEVYENASISKEWTRRLKEECTKIGIDYFTSPYDFESVDHVDPFVDLYKIGSGDITWIEIIEYIIGKNKPVLIACGASTMDEVKQVMDIALSKTSDIVLMQCNTNYTADAENFKYCNLNVLKTFAELYPNTILGLSDHTFGHSTTLGAITLGARVIEKHFTSDNNLEGPDHAFAMNPVTWKEMVERSYELLHALGDGVKRVEENEVSSRIVQRRCLRAKRDIVAGTVITHEEMIALRPISDGGIEPNKISQISGKSIKHDIKKGDHFTFEMFL